jgi:hypothetical protein
MGFLLMHVEGLGDQYWNATLIGRPDLGGSAVRLYYVLTSKRVLVHARISDFTSSRRRPSLRSLSLNSLRALTANCAMEVQSIHVENELANSTIYWCVKYQGIANVYLIKL